MDMYMCNYYVLNRILVSLQEIEQDMLPEACLQKVEEYKDRLVNFKARRRKSSISLSPALILQARGVRVFPEDSTCSSSTTSTTSRSVLDFTSHVGVVEPWLPRVVVA